MGKLTRGLYSRTSMIEDTCDDTACAWLGWDGWVNVVTNFKISNPHFSPQSAQSIRKYSTSR